MIINHLLFLSIPDLYPMAMMQPLQLQVHSPPLHKRSAATAAASDACLTLLPLKSKVDIDYGPTA